MRKFDMSVNPDCPMCSQEHEESNPVHLVCADCDAPGFDCCIQGRLMLCPRCLQVDTGREDGEGIEEDDYDDDLDDTYQDDDDLSHDD